jgi:Uma2 family endonuclease
MLAHPTDTPMTVEDYVAFERDSQVKHEYIDGYVYAMAGGTPTYGVITVNVTTAIRVRLRGGPCRVYSSDVRVQLTSTRYVYPDLSVGCDPRDRVPAGVEQEGISYAAAAGGILPASSWRGGAGILPASSVF